jgi:hypothetical protein
MPRTENNFMKATEFIALLNQATTDNGLFIGQGQNGGVFTAITAEDGKRHFINRVPVYASVIDGVAIPAVDPVTQQPIYKWALGKEMAPRA